jgi:hypothetical protein
MPREMPPVAPDQLFPRRLAYRAFCMALDGLGLDAIAVKLNPDDPWQVRPTDDLPNEFGMAEHKLMERGPVARVQLLDERRARVTIRNIDACVRHAHLRDFDARSFVNRRPGFPDVEIEVDLTDVIRAEGDSMRTLPQRRPAPGTGPSSGGLPSGFQNIRAYKGD